MAFFRVGMRVRIVACNGGSNAERLVGKEARVNSTNKKNTRGEAGMIGVTVSNEDFWVFWPHQLEPIIDKQEPCESEFKASLDCLLEKVGERVR
jgi:hypothetical protein